MIRKMAAMVKAFLLSVLATLEDGYEAVADKIYRVACGETVFVDSGIWTLPAFLPERMAANNRGQLGFQTVIAASVVVIAVMLVVIVVDQFDQSLGDPGSSDLNNASNDVLSGFSDMASLIGPLLIVAIAVVIISLIRRAQT